MLAKSVIQQVFVHVKSLPVGNVLLTLLVLAMLVTVSSKEHGKQLATNVRRLTAVPTVAVQQLQRNVLRQQLKEAQPQLQPLSGVLQHRQHSALRLSKLHSVLRINKLLNAVHQ